MKDMEDDDDCVMFEEMATILSDRLPLRSMEDLISLIVSDPEAMVASLRARVTAREKNFK